MTSVNESNENQDFRGIEKSSISQSYAKYGKYSKFVKRSKTWPTWLLFAWHPLIFTEIAIKQRVMSLFEDEFNKVINK